MTDVAVLFLFENVYNMKQLKPWPFFVSLSIHPQVDFTALQVLPLAITYFHLITTKRSKLSTCRQRISSLILSYMHIRHQLQRSQSEFRIEYVLGGYSSFSGECSCARIVQEVGSQTPGRVVVRLSMCSNVYVRKLQALRDPGLQIIIMIRRNPNLFVSYLCII